MVTANPFLAWAIGLWRSNRLRPVAMYPVAHRYPDFLEPALMLIFSALSQPHATYGAARADAIGLLIRRPELGKLP